MFKISLRAESPVRPNYRAHAIVLALAGLLGVSTAFAAAPVAVDDIFLTNPSVAVSGVLAINDTGLDGPSDTYSLATSPASGIAVVNTDSSFTYTPNAGFSGADDTFTYSVNDGAGGVSSATVTITVAAATDFLSAANPLLITPEDTPVPLNISVAQDLFDGGSLQDIVSSDVLFRPDNAGLTPLITTIPAGVTGITITGFSTQSQDTAGNNEADDDYQLLNVRIDLNSGVSSGRLANLVDGRLTLLDQYNWQGVALGQSVLADPSKITGFSTGASDPVFSVVGDKLYIVETHSLETVYHVEFTTSTGDSANFLGAASTVQVPGVSTSTIEINPGVEPATGKHGIVILSGFSGAASTNFVHEHKGFSRLVIDFDTGTISGAIAALRGETEANTVTYGFEGYPLVDLRNGPALISDVLTGSAIVTGDVNGTSEVLDNPALYIDAAGDLVIKRATGFANTFTTMYTGEAYERTGFSSIASFVDVSSDDTLFNTVGGVASDGGPANEWHFNVPASAKLGLAQMSWNTIGGNDTNENVGFGFAVIDFENGVSSGSITFLRATTPDLISWDAVPLNTTIFGATDASGNPLYQSNKTAGTFTDLYGQTAKFTLVNNADGTRTLVFTANNANGTQSFRSYQGNAQISWLGSEPFEIEGVPVTGMLSLGSPTAGGNWQIDFTELSQLSYVPLDDSSDVVNLDFSLSSSGETESIEIYIEPVVDAVTLTANDVAGYVDLPFPLSINLSALTDIDGSETEPEPLTLQGVPASVVLTSSAGTVTNTSSGVWEVSGSALASLQALSPTAASAIVSVTGSQEDDNDLDGSGVIDDGGNSVGADEFDIVNFTQTFQLDVFDIPTVISQTTNQPSPIISGDVVIAAGETFTVTVNGVTYINGDGNLVVNANGTWDLNVPASDAIPEGTYSVVAEKSHSGGSAAPDLTSSELVIDITPPPAPGITSQTTQNATPTINGTAPLGTGSILTVVVNGVTYTEGDGHLVINGDGTWSLTIPAVDALPDALYQVMATLTDAAGNTASDPGVDDLLVDTTAPSAPGVTSLVTNDDTPTVSGTAILGSGDTLTVEVNGITYTAGDGNLIDNGDGTWALTIPPTAVLPEANYDVTASVTDSVRNVSSDPSSAELTVDLTAPATPIVLSQFTNDSTPVISGFATVLVGELLTVDVNGVTYTAGDGNLVDNGDGTWGLTIPATDALLGITYDVTATVSDGAGNGTSDGTLGELIIDLIAPPIPAVVSQLTNNTTPTITGTAIVAAGDLLTVEVNGVVYSQGDGNLVLNPSGTWSLTIPVADALADGSYEVIATVTDFVGNPAVDISSLELVVDNTPPPAPGVTSQTTQNPTPSISGAIPVNTGLTLSVEVNGVTYTVGDGNLVDNGDGTWGLTIPAVDSLPDGIYQVVATLIDSAGNVSLDPGVDDLVVDTVAPTTPGVTSLVTNNITPTISGTAVVGANEVLTVEVNSVVYTAGDGNLVDNGDSTWDLSIPAIDALVEANYNVTAIVTDVAGNPAIDPSSGELTVDLTAPTAPTVTAQATNNPTPVVSGTATVGFGELLTVDVNGVIYIAGDGNLVDNTDGTWDLTIPAADALVETTYDIIVTVTDGAGNATLDATIDELVVDLTPPATPTANNLLTSNPMPALSGGALMGATDVLTIEVNGIVYTAGDGNLLDNGNGTWDLIIPPADALVDGAYDVIVTVTDGVGNSAIDLTTNELVVDTTPPAAPGVTSLTTQNSTPIIMGTLPVATGITLTIDVNGIVYTAGDGNLVINPNGTWSLSIPAANTLADGLYQVLATLTDAAGNRSVDAGVDDLVVDTTAPPTPGVTSQVTNNTTPVISGTAVIAPADVLTVEVNGITYTAGDGNMVDNADGTWDLTLPAGDALPEAVYDVTAIITDIAGNVSVDPSSTELVIDLTAPSAPSVNSLLTNNQTPVVSGTATVGVGEVLTVEVNGVSYTQGDGNLVVNATNGWTLTIPAVDALPEAVYEVTVTVTDAAGNSSSDSSLDELEIDLTPTAPPLPVIAADADNNGLLSIAEAVVPQPIDITLPPSAGVGYTLSMDDGTSVTTIVLTAADIAAGVVSTTATLPADGSLFTVRANLQDLAGNVSTDGGDLALVDITQPVQPSIVISEDANNDTFINVAENLGLIDVQVLLPGSASIGDVLTTSIRGVVTTQTLSAVNVAAGIVNLTTTAPAHGAFVIAEAFITDTAGNSSTTADDVASLDISPPFTPGVNSQVTNTGTPLITGTAAVGPSDILSVSVNGVTYIDGDGNLVYNANGTWSLTIPAVDAMVSATYDVAVQIEDPAGNVSVDTTVGELIVDLVPPATPTVNSLLTNLAAPTLTGSASVVAGEVLSVTVNGVTYTDGDGNLALNAAGAWTLIIPAANALVDATYEVIAEIADAAGNTTSDVTVDELVVDLTPPPIPSVIFLLTNNQTPVVSGAAIVSAGETLTVTISGAIYTAGDGNLIDNGDGTWDLTLPASAILTEGVYTVVAKVEDVAGNTSTDTTVDELIIDLTPAPAPGVTSQTTQDTTPLITGTFPVGTGLVLTVSVDGVLYTLGDGNLVDNADGTWSLTIPTANLMSDGLYQVVASVTDAAGNTSIDAGVDDLVVDTISPPTPGVTSLVTNSPIPTVFGTATVGVGEVLSVEINGITYTAGDGNLIDNGDGTWGLTIPTADALPEANYDVTAIVTDPAGNVSIDPSSAELIVDLTAPAVPTVDFQLSNSPTPVVTGTATLQPGEVLTVLINGVLYTAGDGNLVDNADGTWSLPIPLGNALAEANYDVAVMVVDLAGNNVSEGTLNELDIDLTATLAPTVILTADINNDALLNTQEAQDPQPVDMLLPAGAAVGDTLLWTDGSSPGNTVLTAADIAAGVVSTTVSLPADGSVLTVSARIVDQAGNVSPAGNDSATVDITIPTAPTIVIAEDADDNSLLNIAESNGPVDVSIRLPLGVSSGDLLTMTLDGVVSTLVLNASHIVAGVVNVTTPAPVHGSTVLAEAFITDPAGNATVSVDDTAIVDTSAPFIPTVHSLLTNNATPVLTGNAAVGPGDILTVTVNGITYIDGDGALTDNGSGAWALIIPANNALADATYDVAVSLTDPAGNTSIDISVDELVVDTVAPLAPGITSQTTADSTPLISGTTPINAGFTLSVEVNGVTYTQGDGNLVVNSDGSWNLTLPPADALIDGLYQVVAIVTDSAGNSSVDSGLDELAVDTVSPTTPGVTSQVTNNTVPTIVGTAAVAVGETLTVVVNGITYIAGDGNLIDNGDGTWQLIIPVVNALPEAIYSITTSVIDLAGNISVDPSRSELTIDLTAPDVPTVTAQLSNSPSPFISGTAQTLAGETLSVEVNGVLYTAGDGNLVDNGDASWTLTIPSSDALAEATYDVTVNVIDQAGNSANDATVNELVIDLSPTAAPTPILTADLNNDAFLNAAEAINLQPITILLPVGAQSGDDLLWSDIVTPASKVLNAADIAAGFVLTSAPLPADGSVLNITAVLVDLAGNASPAGSDSATVDLAVPVAPTIVITEDADDDSFVNVSESIGLVDVAVSLPPNAVVGDTLVIDLDGVSSSVVLSAVDIAVGVVNATAQAPMQGANIIAEAYIFDAAGNASVVVNDIAVVDVSAPFIPSVNALVTNNTAPIVTGFAAVGPGDFLEVTVNGVIYTVNDGALVDNGDGTWSLSIPSADALIDGIYDVHVRITDPAGNSSVDISLNELVIDTIAPQAPGVTSQTTRDQTPLISGNYAQGFGYSLTVLVNGIVYQQGDGNLTIYPDGTWELIIPNADLLADNLYQVTATSTDLAGNSASDPMVDDLLIDTTQPTSPGVTSLATNDVTPVIDGTALVALGETLSVEVNGVTYTASDGNLVDNGDGTWSLTLPISDALAEGVYDVVASITDAAGNISTDPSSSELLIDLTVPIEPSVIAQSTNIGTPVIQGTVQLLPGETFTVSVNGVTYSVGDGNLVVNADGTWTLSIPATDALLEGSYNVVASVSDSAGNVITDATLNELEVDITAPLAPMFTDVLSGSNTPTLAGQVQLALGDVFTVTVNGVTYTVGDGFLSIDANGNWVLALDSSQPLADGVYDVSLAIEDAAGNLIANAAGEQLTIDTGAPGLTVSESGVLTTLRPPISGTSEAVDGSVVTIRDAEGNIICAAIVANGQWSCTPTADLPEGVSNLTAEVADPAGNVSVVNFSLTISSDFDGDGIANSIEGFGDSDGDGVPDSADLDSDNDGLPDADESIGDADGDGLANYLDGDADNDGLADIIEAQGFDVDSNFTVDNFIDNDNNGLSDDLQAIPLTLVDTDFDGVADYLDVDADNDGVPDVQENLGVDSDNNGRIDQFVDVDANGVDDGIQAFPLVVLDTDNDGIPNYLDLNSDNDGLSDVLESVGLDLNEDSIVDAMTDVDQDGIPDSVDFSIIGGSDADGDGIEDSFDSDFILGDDTDGDGIVDAFDPDANGDGFFDASFDQANLPDFDSNGVPDLQEAFGELRTGVNGRGGCAIDAAGVSSRDPLLLMLVLFSVAGFLRQRKKMASGSSTKNAPWLVCLLLLWASLMHTDAAHADDAGGFHKRIYIGIGAGASYLDPDESAIPFKLESRSDFAWGGYVGYDLGSRVSLEFGYNDLGRAELQQDHYVEYTQQSISALVYGFNRKSARERRSGLSAFARVGASKMNNKTDIGFVRDNDISLLIGVGVELGIRKALAWRGEITSYDMDSNYLGLSLLYRFGHATHKQLPAKTKPESSVVTSKPILTPQVNELSPVPETLTVQEYAVLFNTNRWSLEQEAQQIVHDIEAYLRANPTSRVVVTGFADLRGSQTRNMRLSEERAQVVADSLIQQGIARDRIRIDIGGPTSAFGPMSSRAGRRENRRARIVLHLDKE